MKMENFSLITFRINWCKDPRNSYTIDFAGILKYDLQPWLHGTSLSSELLAPAPTGSRRSSEHSSVTHSEAWIFMITWFPSHCWGMDKNSREEAKLSMKFSFKGLNVIDVLCSPFPRSPRLIIVFILLSHSRRRNDPLHAGRMELSSAALCEYCRVLTISWGTAELRPFIRISTHCDSRLVVSFILLKEASCCTNNKQIIHSFSARPFLNTTTQSNENTHAYSPLELIIVRKMPLDWGFSESI